MADDGDELRTQMRRRSDAWWPMALAVGCGVVATYACAILAPAWRDLLPYAVGVAVGAAVWVGLERVRRPTLVDVVVTSTTVTIGGAPAPIEGAAAALSAGLLEDRHLRPTVDALLARRKARRGAVPIRDLHAIVGYLRDEGLRGQLEVSAWAEVDQGSQSGAKGPEIRLWLDAEGVAKGELVDGKRVFGGTDPDERRPVTGEARCYAVPTRLDVPERGRAWLEPQLTKLRRE